MIINFILRKEIETQTGDITHLWNRQQSLDWPKAAWASPKNRDSPLVSGSNPCPLEGFPPEAWLLARANSTKLLARPAAPSLLTVTRMFFHVCLHSLPHDPPLMKGAYKSGQNSVWWLKTVLSKCRCCSVQVLSQPLTFCCRAKPRTLVQNKPFSGLSCDLSKQGGAQLSLPKCGPRVAEWETGKVG